MTLGNWALLIKIIAAFSSDKYVSQCRLYMVNDNILDAKCTKNIYLEKERGTKYCTKGMMCKDTKAWTFDAGPPSLSIVRCQATTS